MAEKKFWTVVVTWGNQPADLEELDIAAPTEFECRRIARYKLDADYESNWRIVSVEQRHPEVQGWPRKEDQS